MVDITIIHSQPFKTFTSLKHTLKTEELEGSDHVKIGKSFVIFGTLAKHLK
jgi:hypothetical protein